MKTRHSFFPALLACVLLTALTIPGWCEAEARKESRWETTAAAGLSFSGGNSDSLVFNLGFLSTYRDEDEDIELGMDYYLTKDYGETSSNILRATGAYDRNISEKFYFGFSGSLLTNEASNLDYRLDLNPVIGYYFFRSDESLLSLELGPGYAFESKDGLADSFATIRLAQHYDYRWTDIARIRQSTSLTPRVDDPGSYIFEFQAGVDLRINDQWDIRPRFTHRVDLSPAFGQEKADSLLTIGLAYSLNGFLKTEAKRADERKTLMPDREKKEGTRMGWIRNLATSLSTAKGNSDNFNLLVNFETNYRSKENEFFFKTDYRYGQNRGVSTANRIQNNTRYNWKFDPRNYAGIGISSLHDDTIDLSYRITPGVHAGRYVILTDMGGLSFEGGIGSTFEKLAGMSSTNLSFSAAQRIYWQIGDHTYLTQEVAFEGLVEDPGRFNLSSYLYADTFIGQNLTLRLGLQYYYNSDPAEGFGNYDSSVSTGISYRF